MGNFLIFENKMIKIILLLIDENYIYDLLLNNKSYFKKLNHRSKKF